MQLLTPMRFMYEGGDLSKLTEKELRAFVNEYDLLHRVLWHDCGMKWSSAGENVEHLSRMASFAVRLIEVEFVKRLGDERECDCLDPKKSSCEMCRVESDAFREEMREAAAYEADRRDDMSRYYEV
jgi:Mn-dependent DtxR family transcriptional regulator